MKTKEKTNHVVSKEIDEMALSLKKVSEDFCEKFTFPNTSEGKEHEEDFLDDVVDNGMATNEDEQQQLISKYKKYYHG
jgi:hypothetical protein